MSNTTKTEVATSTKTEAAKAEKKIGVVRFLQLYTQKRGIEALLKSKYASTARTVTEWKALVDELLHSKTK